MVNSQKVQHRAACLQKWPKKCFFLSDWFLLQARTDGFCTLVTAEELRVISAHINTGKFGKQVSGHSVQFKLIKIPFYTFELEKRLFGKNIYSWHMESKLWKKKKNCNPIKVWGLDICQVSGWSSPKWDYKGLSDNQKIDYAKSTTFNVAFFFCEMTQTQRAQMNKINGSHYVLNTFSSLFKYIVIELFKKSHEVFRWHLLCLSVETS